MAEYKRNIHTTIMVRKDCDEDTHKTYEFIKSFGSQAKRIVTTAVDQLYPDMHRILKADDGWYYSQRGQEIKWNENSKPLKEKISEYAKGHNPNINYEEYEEPIFINWGNRPARGKNRLQYPEMYCFLICRELEAGASDFIIDCVKTYYSSALEHQSKNYYFWPKKTNGDSSIQATDSSNRNGSLPLQLRSDIGDSQNISEIQVENDETIMYSPFEGNLVDKENENTIEENNNSGRESNDPMVIGAYIFD